MHYGFSHRFPSSVSTPLVDKSAEDAEAMGVEWGGIGSMAEGFWCFIGDAEQTHACCTEDGAVATIAETFG